MNAKGLSKNIATTYVFFPAVEAIAKCFTKFDSFETQDNQHALIVEKFK